MATMKTHRLQITQTFDASCEEVFQAWLNPEAMRHFMAPSDAFDIPEVQVDPRVGGQYRIVMISPDRRTLIGFGTYVEIVPNKKIVCTWNWEKGEAWADIGETILTLEFREKGSATELTLTHKDFPAADMKDGHFAGWNGTLSRFRKLIEKH